MSCGLRKCCLGMMSLAEGGISEVSAPFVMPQITYYKLQMCFPCMVDLWISSSLAEEIT